LATKGQSKTLINLAGTIRMAAMAYKSNDAVRSGVIFLVIVVFEYTYYMLAAGISSNSQLGSPG